MTISKRLRYEILRRDNHQCRYCGEAAPDAKLTVDHVTPTTLGGNDDPTNLVAACKDCNAGKSSMPDLSIIGPNDPIGTEDVRVPIPRPSNWELTLWRFHKCGLPIEEVEDAVVVACGNNKVRSAKPRLMSS